MKKALNAWSVPRKFSFEEMFRDLSAAGFVGVELNLDKEDFSCHSLIMGTGKDTFDEINRLSVKYHLPITSISSSMYSTTFGSSDKAKREIGKSVLRKQLECAAALGADTILAVPSGDFKEVSLLQAYDNSFVALEELKPEIEAAKIKVGLENVWNAFFMSPFDMRNFIDSFKCSYIGAYFDVGNVVAISEPENWIEILGSRIFKVHVKDFMRNSGINRGGSFVNLLEGDVNWIGVKDALDRAGYDSYLTAELSTLEHSPEYLYHITSDALSIIIEGGKKL